MGDGSEFENQELDITSKVRGHQLPAGDLASERDDGGPGNAAQDMSWSPPWGVDAHAETITSRALSESIESRFETQEIAAVHASLSSAHPESTAKTEPLHCEQEAFWLGRRESSGVANVGGEHTQEPEEFRVYPHYIPIPATSESTSLPFLSGDPLIALGHDLGKNTSGEAEANSTDRVDQKLQFQLAIHDVSVCWRLFKGRDWLQVSTSENKTALRGDGEGKDQYSAKSGGRSVPVEASIEAKRFSAERRREVSNESSTTAGSSKLKKTELLDALLENYQDDRGRHGDMQTRRRVLRQPKVKLLNLPREPGSTISGGTGRDTSCMLEVVLEHASLRLDNFHPGRRPTLLSNLLLSIHNLHACDTLTSSRPRKTLQHWRDDIRHPREYQQKMVTVHMTARSPSDHYCPGDTPLGDELMLKVRILPVRLSFGQHTVDFLRSFSPKPQPYSVSAMDGPRGDHASAAEDPVTISPFFVSCCDVGACKVRLLSMILRQW